MNTTNTFLRIEVLKIARDLPTPKYADEGAAGMDLYIDHWETPSGWPDKGPSYDLDPGDRVLVKTGIRLAIPDGYEGQIRPRSGLALRNGITVLNSPGTIDASYRGEIGIILINHSRTTFEMKRGDRIAQIVFNKVERAFLKIVPELMTTARGDGGFGSTGV